MSFADPWRPPKSASFWYRLSMIGLACIIGLACDHAVAWFNDKPIDSNKYYIGYILTRSYVGIMTLAMMIDHGREWANTEHWIGQIEIQALRDKNLERALDHLIATFGHFSLFDQEHKIGGRFDKIAWEENHGPWKSGWGFEHWKSETNVNLRYSIYRRAKYLDLILQKPSWNGKKLTISAMKFLSRAEATIQDIDNLGDMYRWNNDLVGEMLKEIKAIDAIKHR